MAGISAAVAVPVVANASQSKRDVTSVETAPLDQTNSTGGNFAVEKCADQQTTVEGSSVTFGSNGLTKVCWRVDSSIQEEVEKGKANQILKSSWSSPSSWGNLSTSEVKSYCDSTSSSDEEKEGEDAQTEQDPTSITLWKNSSPQDPCNGVGYLKLGSSSNAFLKKKKDGGNKWQVWFCGGDCWSGSSSFSETSVNQSLQENADKWKEVSFQQLLSS